MRRAAAPFAANPQLHAKTLARHASISPPLLFSSPATSVALTYKHVLYQDKLNDEQHCVSSLAALQVMQIEPVNHGMEALGTSRRRWLRPSRRPELDENTTGGTPEKKPWTMVVTFLARDYGWFMDGSYSATVL